MGYFRTVLFIGMVCAQLGCEKRHNVLVPSTRDPQIYVDGFIKQVEWEGAYEQKVDSSGQVYLIQDEDDLFVAIETGLGSLKYVDVYLANESIGVLNLHASMQLGERILGKHWNDTIPRWDWGNNSEWSANFVKMREYSKERSFLESIEPYEGYEFRISKKRLNSKNLNIRIEIKDFMGRLDQIVFPKESDRQNTINWFKVAL